MIYTTIFWVGKKFALNDMVDLACVSWFRVRTWLACLWIWRTRGQGLLFEYNLVALDATYLAGCPPENLVQKLSIYQCSDWITLYTCRHNIIRKPCLTELQITSTVSLLKWWRLQLGRNSVFSFSMLLLFLAHVLLREGVWGWDKACAKHVGSSCWVAFPHFD